MNEPIAISHYDFDGPYRLPETEAARLLGFARLTTDTVDGED